jgi:prepilin-type processing-associated H-X9-DG protein
MPPIINPDGDKWVRIFLNEGYMKYEAGQGGRPFFACPSYGDDTPYEKNWSLDACTYGIQYDVDGNTDMCWNIFKPKVLVENANNPQWINVSGQRSPSEFIIFADTASLGISSEQQWYYFIRAESNTAAKKLLHLRHSNKANCVFADGHAEGIDKQKAVELDVTHYKTQKGCNEIGEYY